MYYVYILKSLRDNSFYKGVTTDLKKRILDLASHFEGGES